MNYPKLKPGQEVFGTKESADILDFGDRRFQDFLQNGLIQFGVKVQWGDKGNHRTVFNHNDLYLLKMLDRLLNMGIKRSLAAQMIEFIDCDIINPDLTRWIIFKGFDSYKSKGQMYYTPIMGSEITPDGLLSALHNSNVNVVINIKEIVESVDEAIKQYREKNGK